MHTRLTAALCCLMLSACAAPKDVYTLTPSGNQQAIVRQGVPALVSSKRHVIFLRPVASQQASHARPHFVVAILNRTKAPVTFNATDIAVEAVRPKRARLKVYSHAELVEEVETQRNTQLFISALAGAAGAYSASQSGYSHTTGSYNRYGSYGSSYGTYSATTYNPAVAQAAINANADRTANNMASIEAQAQGKLAELQATIIKDHTLMPGEWHGGVIVIAAPERSESEEAEYSISIPFDGERHSFTVKQRKGA